MKKLMLILAPFMALSSYADTLINVTTSTGTVAPAFQKTTNCKIDSTIVYTLTTGPLIDFPHTVQKQVKFTRAVPNADVARSLIVEAGRGTVRQMPAPIGAGITTYIATVPGSTVTTMLAAKTGSIATIVNTSPAAAKLVAFAAKNCN